MLEQVDWVCLSTILSDQEVPQEGQGGEGIAGVGGSNMKVPTMVSSSVGASDGLSPDPPSGPRVADGPLQQPTPTSSGRTVTSSRLETIQHRQLAAGILGETSQLLAAGWSNGTN